MYTEVGMIIFMLINWLSAFHCIGTRRNLNSIQNKALDLAAGWLQAVELLLCFKIYQCNGEACVLQQMVVNEISGPSLREIREKAPRINSVLWDVILIK